MHRILALKFAAWLNPRFELWVYSTIESLMFGKHVEREHSLKRSKDMREEMEILKSKKEKTGSDFERYVEIEILLRHEKTIRRMLTKDSINEMKSLFAEDEE